MSRNKNKRKKELKETKSYQNPANTLWGKIVIWSILIAMVGAVILGLVIALINL